jgi:hypothetical protein
MAAIASTGRLVRPSEALGASWDDVTKCWYLDAGVDQKEFQPWLDVESCSDDELTISSTEACVASAVTACSKCEAAIEVICLFCMTGTIADEGYEPMTEFTLSHIYAMDTALARQLEIWPSFHKGFSSLLQDSYFANHCPHCGTLQEDTFLHMEPDAPFFDIPHAPPDRITLIRLPDPIRLGSDYSFQP